MGNCLMYGRGYYGLGQTSGGLTWLVAIAVLGLFLVSGSSRYRISK